MPDSTMLRAMFIEWAHDQAIATPGMGVDAEPFMAKNDVDPDLAYKIVRSCADVGWVNDVSSMGGLAVDMTFEGIAQVQAQRARRKNPAVRAAAVRNGLLHYFYAAEHAGERYPATVDFLRSEESLFLGEQFSVTEIDKAAAYLLNKGLITGVEVAEFEGPTHAQVTPDGTDCVEQFDGDVQKYINHRNGGAGSMVTTNIGTFNNSGAAAIGSTNVSQQVTVGADAAALGEFARVLLDKFEELSVGDDLKAEVRAALEEIQNEAKDETAPGRLKAALGRFAGYLVKAGQPVLTAAFMVLAMRMGLPPAE